MHSRFWSVLSTSFILLGCLLGIVEAQTTEEDKTRIGNETIERMVQLRTHSLYAPYIDQDLQNRWWDFGADAYVNTNKHIRLTQNRPSQMGWLWSRLSVSALNFVIEVEFKITGDSSHLYGDGLAVWLTKDRATEGPVFGSKDNFEGLGIFLDTYANGHHSYPFPRVSGMLGDGKANYDYGDDGAAQSVGGCSANFRRTNVATKLRITYVRDKFIDVKIQYKGWDDWTDCFLVKNVSLPALPYIGLTAMTGDVSDAHDIIAVTTYSAILEKDPLHDKKKTGFFSKKPKTASPDGQGEGVGFFVKLFIFAGVCVGGYFGYREYQRRQLYGGGGNFGLGHTGGSGGFGGGMYSGNKRLY